MSAVKQVIETYLLVWLVLLAGLAYGADRWLPVDIFSATKDYLPHVIAVTMFAIGWMLPRDEVAHVMARWPTVFGGTAVQFLAMPTLAYLLADQFQLTGALRIGVIMTGCVPGAMASNVLTLVARGNTSYSVSLTTVATLLSPIVVPIALHLALGRQVDRNIIFSSALQLTWMVVLPVISGYSLSRLFPRYHDLAQKIGSIVANLTILWIVAVVVAVNRGNLTALEPTLVVVLVLLNLLGYAAGFTGGKLMRLAPGMRRALTLEVGMQNAGLGTALVTALFSDPLTAVPPALYTFGCMFSGTVLARYWQRHGVEEP